MNKKGRWSSVVFVVIMALPLLGLLIMNYQVEEANQLTGMASNQQTIGVSVPTLIIVVIALTASAVISVYEIRKSNRVKTRSLADINKDISKLEEQIKTMK